MTKSQGGVALSQGYGVRYSTTYREKTTYHSNGKVASHESTKTKAVSFTPRKTDWGVLLCLKSANIIV